MVLADDLIFLKHYKINRGARTQSKDNAHEKRSCVVASADKKGKNGADYSEDNRLGDFGGSHSYKKRKEKQHETVKKCIIYSTVIPVKRVTGCCTQLH